MFSTIIRIDIKFYIMMISIIVIEVNIRAIISHLITCRIYLTLIFTYICISRLFLVFNEIVDSFIVLFPSMRLSVSLVCSYFTENFLCSFINELSIFYTNRA